jgi:hypothetical protein
MIATWSACAASLASDGSCEAIDGLGWPAAPGGTGGAAVGGIAGGLIGLGIPELEAKRYEGKVKAGNLLISVHTENSEEISRAKDIFTKAGAQDICTTGEASTPKDRKAADRAAHSTEESANLRRAA